MSLLRRFVIALAVAAEVGWLITYPFPLAVDVARGGRVWRLSAARGRIGINNSPQREIEQAFMHERDAHALAAARLAKRSADRLLYPMLRPEVREKLAEEERVQLGRMMALKRVPAPLTPPISDSIPFGSVLALCLTFFICDFVRLLLVRERIRRGLCPCCGYDLRATVDRCPECGTSVQRLPKPMRLSATMPCQTALPLLAAFCAFSRNGAVGVTVHVQAVFGGFLRLLRLPRGSGTGMMLYFCGWAAFAAAAVCVANAIGAAVHPRLHEDRWYGALGVSAAAFMAGVVVFYFAEWMEAGSRGAAFIACAHCGYNITNEPGNVCPACKRPIPGRETTVIAPPNVSPEHQEEYQCTPSNSTQP